MTRLLARPTAIVTSLFACILLLGGFAIARVAIGGGAFLDTLFQPEAVAARLDELSAGQRAAHVWITALLDTAYPLAYGALLLGVTARYLPKRMPLAALPAAITVILDFAENIVQIALLQGAAGAEGLKLWLTPAKFGFLLFAVMIALIGFLLPIVRRRLHNWSNPKG